MAKARYTAAHLGRQRDPVLVALFKVTGQHYEQGIIELAARLMVSLQQVRDNQARKPLGATQGTNKHFLEK